MWAGVAKAEIITSVEDLEISEGGNFVLKTTQEMTKPEFAIIANAGCAALGFDCSEIVEATQNAARSVHTLTQGEDYRISGIVTQHGSGSQEWAGIFPAPRDYEICKAVIDWGNGSITGDSSISGQIERDTQWNGLGFYVVVPKNKSTGQWVQFHIITTYVPAGSLSENHCWPSGTIAWACKGQYCGPIPGGHGFYPGARM
jgi:hypothetical protein